MALCSKNQRQGKFESSFSLAMLTATVLLLCTPFSVHAEKADKDKPMNAQSDTLRYDDIKQVSIFTGNVIITKGTIIMRGNQIEVRQDPEGFQYATATPLSGQLAFFRQKRDGGDEYIEGDGEIIEYDGKADRVRLIKRAELRRLVGSTLQDQVSGSLITYNNLTDVYNVEGGAGSKTSNNPTGRVRAVLGPKTTPTGKPSTTNNTHLRSSQTLEIEKK